MLAIRPLNMWLYLPNRFLCVKDSIFHFSPAFNAMMFCFQFFGGQKYGYRPIPAQILGSEFLMLREALKSMNIDIVTLDTWYKVDTNAVPCVYILQFISSILVNFNNKVSHFTYNIMWDDMMWCKVM